MTDAEIKGLSINERQFRSMKAKDQMTCLFANQVETLKIIKSYKLHQKVQYVLFSLTGVGFLILFKAVIG